MKQCKVCGVYMVPGDNWVVSGKPDCRDTCNVCKNAKAGKS
jgi:hypothetical protein